MPKLIQFPSRKPAPVPEPTPEERALAQRNAYVEQHKNLVTPIAKSILQRLPPSFELDDLEQAGYVGLIRAAATYSRAKGAFAMWAKWRIRDHILDAVRRKNYTAATCLPLVTPSLRDQHTSFDESRLGSDTEESRNQPTTVVPIDGAIHQAQTAAKVRQAMEMLPDEERTILEMYYFQESQLRGVGEFLGVGMSRSSQRVQMAREQLAERLRSLGVVAA